MTGSVKLFEDRGWIKDGEYTQEGLSALAELMRSLQPVHKGQWGPLFVPFMSKLVPACVELVIVRNKKVLLTRRHDAYFNGWHTPGTFIGPDETWQQAATRAAKRELQCDVVFERYLTSFLQTTGDNLRFAELGSLILCRLESDPANGRWFSAMPYDILEHHRKFWPTIASVLES